MDLNLIESLIYGFVAGIVEILPVSGLAHRKLLLQLMGQSSESALLRFMIHAGILAALYYSCRNHILRMIRAQRLARVPKRRRKRPLDVRSLMDLSLLKTMILPAAVLLLAYGKISALNERRVLVSVLLFVNGIILYIPPYLPGSNRDSRTLSRVEGLCMGLGGAVSVLPGISCTGTAYSVSCVCGVDKNYGVNMALLMTMVMTAGWLVHDVLGIIGAGLSGISFMAVLGYILAGIAAFAGAFVSVRLLRACVANRGVAPFAIYCWGIALFTFILYISV